MRVEKHILISSAVSIPFYLLTKSIFFSFLFFMSSVLIDLDHAVDYFSEVRWRNGSLKFHIINMFKKFNNFDMKKAYIILHSYEILVVMLLLCFKFHLFIPIFYGFSLHILLDVVSGQAKSPLCYSLIYRAKKKFKFNNFFSKSAQDAMKGEEK